jgi:outer membrane autotransporter protein
VVNANFRNNAEVDVGMSGAPGLLTIAGDYTQGAGGVVVVEIAGLTAGSNFDQLAITGQATLDGTLTVRLSGFVPNSGDSFAILTFSSGTGTFATINGDGGAFTPSYDATDVTLVAN